MSFAITGLSIGVSRVAARFGRVERQVNGAVAKGMRRGCRGGVGLIRANAQGRPGPRRIWGDYLRSWDSQVQRVGDNKVLGIIGSDAPQGPKLEYGWDGEDSLGRYSFQPPYPHIGPAVPEIEKLCFDEIHEAIIEMLKS